jgi:hypothetical protein
MALKAKMHDTKMGKEESVSSYLTRVAQVKYELVVVGEVILGFRVGEDSLERLHQRMGSLREVCGGS